MAGVTNDVTRRMLEHVKPWCCFACHSWQGGGWSTLQEIQRETSKQRKEQHKGTACALSQGTYTEEQCAVVTKKQQWLLVSCRRAAETNQKVFAEDKVSNLIVRLRHNVIRAGLRRISLAYSRISLADLASKLGLPNVEDTESIVAKAIR